MLVTLRLRFGAALLLCTCAVDAAPTAPWRDAVERVWRDSPEVDAARARRDAVALRAHAAAQPLYNPVLSTDAENADVDRRTLGVSLTLDLARKRAARAAVGTADAASADAGYQLARRRIAIRWLKACTSIAFGERAQALGAQRVEAMQRFDGLAARQLAAGDIGAPDRDLVALALAETRMQQAVLEGEQASADATRQAMLGANVPAPPLPRGLPPLVDEGPTITDNLAEVVEATATRDAARAGEDAARRMRRADPTIALTAGTVHAGALRDRVIGISVSVPLPIRDTGRFQVEAASVDATAADAELTTARYAARAAAIEHGTRYRTLRRAMAAYHGSRADALDERLQTLEKLWQAGELPTADYLQQLKQSMDTALAGIDLERSTWLAFFDYLGASGRLNDWLDGILPPETSR